MPVPDPWDIALDRHIDPPPRPPETATPISFMTRASRGRLGTAPHLQLIQDTVLDAINHGRRRIISVSVRHGKSFLCSRHLPAWYLGIHPDRRVILASASQELGDAHARVARDTLTEYGHLFDVQVSKASSAVARWDLEQPHQGGMLTVGVGGTPIGRGGDLVIVDDPYRSFADAMSPLIRERVIEWWTGTMESRIEPGGAVVLIMARWHEDDLAGFLLKEAPDEWEELRLPAIADSADDPLGRQIGEALWPARYPLAELERRRKAVSLRLGPQVWDAQFQGSPRSPTGGMFPEDRWKFAPLLSEFLNLGAWVRAWDLAATEDGGDWTVGVLIGVLVDGRTVIGDVVRGQWSPDMVRSKITECAQSDPSGTAIMFPQDPGQAGKDQGQQLVRLVVGHDAGAVPQTGSKEVRATGLSAQQRARNVTLIEGDWNGLFVDELRGFPKSGHDDQVDAAASGFNWLVDPVEVEEIWEAEEIVSISPY